MVSLVLERAPLLDALPARVGEQGSALPGDSIDAPELSFDCYQPDASLLSAGGDPVEECLRSDLLKTNCPVTLQPDWATLVVRYRGPRIDREGLLRYVVSFRNHADFHEHCVERIYMDLLQRCRPERLTADANAPGWTEELVEDLTTAYLEDVERILRIPGVRFIEP